MKAGSFIKWLKINSVIVFLNLSVLSNSQEQTIKFEKYTTKEGLSQSSVITILQDDEGFIWFGTYGGLSRFDGYNFFVYQYMKNNPISISDNHVRSIIQDTTGILWVATTGGLNRFFSHTKQFVPYVNNPDDSSSLAHNTVYKILKDKDGEIWLGTWGGGLEKVEKIKEKLTDERKARYTFIHHKHIEGKNSISSDWINDMAEDSDGMIWIATNDGLNKYNKRTNEFTIFKHDPNNKNSLSSSDISSICIDSKGKIWVGTWGDGLNIIDPVTNRISRYRNNPLDKYSISHDIIMELYCDKSGNIWVGTWGGGLNRVLLPFDDNLEPDGSKNDIRFIRYQHNETNLNSISGNSIYSVYEDRTGMIWVGTDWGGINKFEKETAKFAHIRTNPGNPNSLVNNIIFALMIDNQNKLWIGTQEGLNIYDRKTDNFQLFKHNQNNQNSISHNMVRTIAQDKNGIVWLGTLSGLNRYVPETKSFKSYIIDKTNPSLNNILAVCPSSDGKIWVGSYGAGLLCFDPNTGTFQSYRNKTNGQKGIDDDIIWSIIEDRNKDLWIGTRQGGLCKYDHETGDFVRFLNDSTDTSTISNNFVLTVCEDHNGDIWAGTSFGLNKLTFDENNKPVFKRYFQEDGLVAQTINGIVEDNQYNLWITTSLGMSRFNPETERSKNFYLEDGIQDTEFSINATAKDKNSGEIYVGGINGFNVFEPGAIKSNNIPPVVKIVDLKLFNKRVAVRQIINGKVILNQYISSLDNLELSYKENVITFEFAALHYQSPEGNQYAFKLEGFDDDWNYVLNQRTATYTNLKHGKYTFMVKASNSDGVWCENPAILHIKIKPPWWNTIFFKTFLILFIVSLALFIHQFNIRNLKKRQKLLEEMVNVRTEELSEANVMLEEKQEEIIIQNDELVQHRFYLEKLVDERTVELKEAKTKAEESDKLKSAFLANMSHEVRTPMNAIIGFSNLLDDSNIDEEEKNFLITMIKNNGDSLLTLINDILDMSMIEANQLVLYKDLFCIDEILTEIHSYFILKNDKSIDIQIVSAYKNKTFLYNDSVRFRQVMNNLVSNAIKYTDSGYVRFGYKLDDKFVKIFVEDSGVGIEKNNLDRIFDYFYKVESNQTKVYQGTGIGLSICSRLVNLMGGEIKVESEVGKGSTFSFILPKDNSESSVQPSHEPGSIANQDLSGFTIIVAEDESDNYKLIERILRKTGANLVWAHNGLEAVELVKNLVAGGKYIVLMDIKMPVMNGIEANRQIKKINSNLPVIALTAYAQAGDKSRIMQNNFDDYMSKPINPKKLLEMITFYTTKFFGK